MAVNWAGVLGLLACTAGILIGDGLFAPWG